MTDLHRYILGENITERSFDIAAGGMLLLLCQWLLLWGHCKLSTDYEAKKVVVFENDRSA